MNNILFGKGWALKQYDGKSLENFDLLNLQYINIQKYPYLLESSSRGNLNNRFSILFYKPEFSFEKKLEIIFYLNLMNIGVKRR